MHYVMNLLNLLGDRNRIFSVLETIKRDRLGVGSVDFNKIVPFSIGHREAVPASWGNQKWGTRWNTITDYSFDVIEPIEESEHNFQIVFVTAENAVLPIVKQLSKQNPDLLFVYSWAEDTLTDEKCGKYLYVNGRCLGYDLPTGRDATVFSCDVWDVDPEEILDD